MSNFVSVITGGAGFISANLIGYLIEEGATVVAIDNFSRGSYDNLNKYLNNNRLLVIEADLSKRSEVEAVFSKIKQLGPITEVWHLAANSDIPAGVASSEIDLKDTFLTTFEVLHAMRKYSVKVIHFASSSAIYGNHGSQLLHEDSGPLQPISNYGAMKLASEAIISAAAESFLERANIFRFPNVIGTPATHGVIFDFINKLLADSSVLEVLGDGSQQKSYLHVQDLVEAMLVVRSRSNLIGLQVFNVGAEDDGITVSEIARRVVNSVSPKASIRYGSGNKGWIGDIPRFSYSTDKLNSLGWKSTYHSHAAVDKAICEIAAQLIVGHKNEI